MPTRHLSAATDVIIVGAGMIGAACAYYAVRAGLSVTVLDRGPVAGGTTGAGEGNLLVSDKEPGPELDLALLSNRLWRELSPALRTEAEFEPKGGLVVASDESGLDALRRFAKAQGAAGVEAYEIPGDGLHDLEPHLAPGLAGAFRYPQDAQVQPALAASRLLRASCAAVRTGTEVTSVLTGADGSVHGVRTAEGGALHAPYVVNAAGSWVAQLGGDAGLGGQFYRQPAATLGAARPEALHHDWAAFDGSTGCGGGGGRAAASTFPGTTSGP